MIGLEKTGARWTVTLNRTDKANALSRDMLGRLEQIFIEASADKSLRVLVLTGAGERVFCAGADLGEARAANSLTTDPIWARVSQALFDLPILTIAALNGTLAGGGFGLALACDLRISVPNARFFYPVLANGFLPQSNDVRRMIALIGPARTKLILLAGQKLTAVEALGFGLIDRVVERAKMDDEIDSLSKAADGANADPLKAIKNLCQ